MSKRFIDYYLDAVTKKEGSGGGITPSGSLDITANGTYDVTTKASAVVNVPTGGGEEGDIDADVIFIDYDGRVVHSYTKNEFLALSEMPENPSHDGLTAQGWNWSYADAQAYVTKYGKLIVGQMYITDDGDTRVYVHLETLLSPYLGIAPKGTVQVDWGDGSTPDTLTGNSITTVVRKKHEYSQKGDYVIKLTVISGSFAILGSSSSFSYLLFDYDVPTNHADRYTGCIEKVELGENVSVSGYAFMKCYRLHSVTIPSGTKLTSNNVFHTCRSLKALVLPRDCGSILGSTFFYETTGLEVISIPNGVTKFNNYGIYNAYDIERITLPDTFTELTPSFLYNAMCMEEITIPDSVTTLKAIISGNKLITEITIPKNVDTMGSGLLGSCYITTIHMKPTTPPTASSSSIFSSMPTSAVIYVPYSEDHSILEAYKTATNWSNYASYMQEEPQA